MRRGATLLLLAALFACSPSQPTGESGKNGGSMSEDQLTYLALGDSYTIGESVDERMSFPFQLANLMRTRGADLARPVVIARTGWTTDELAAAIRETELAPPYDLVTLLIGVNNQYRGRSVDGYREEIEGLLERSIELAGDDASNVVVISIPDWGATPFATGRDRNQIAAEIDRFNDVKRRAAEAAGARWIDITALSRELSAHESMLAEDTLHPSGMMYAEWARTILPHALDAVRQPQ